jgi:alkyl sulfatase BDS1-like metallo-beta-lactamase superfamily hydrolase
MAALEPELLLPAHGLPVAGTARIRTMLDTIAGVLEHLVAAVLDAMNAGATLDQILADVRVDDALLALPYLRPIYDEPEFVIHNVWRAFGGWWDGNPARLKPPTDAVLGAEIARLAGGPERLAARAHEVAVSGDLRLACQLVEFAADAVADAGAAAVHEARAAIYEARRRAESSLMAKGVFGEAAAASAAHGADPGQIAR